MNGPWATLSQLITESEQPRNHKVLFVQCPHLPGFGRQPDYWRSEGESQSNTQPGYQVGSLFPTAGGREPKAGAVEDVFHLSR